MSVPYDLIIHLLAYHICCNRCVCALDKDCKDKVLITKNDPTNRGEEGRLELKLGQKREILKIWLERRDLFQLFEETEVSSNRGIQEICALVDEDNKQEAKSC